MALKILCDCCEKDITDAGATPTYRFRLICENTPQSGGFTYAIFVQPPVPVGEYYFCSNVCLVNWGNQMEQQQPDPQPIDPIS